MFSFLLPIASKIVSDAIDKIPDDAELGEKLIDLCLVILKKAVNDNLIGDKLDAEILRQRKIKNKFKGKSTDKGV